jgi:hypothetical protein
VCGTAAGRPLPALDQRCQLHLTPDERGQPPRGDGEAAAHPARLHDAIERHRLTHALQHLRAAVLDDEHPGHQTLRRGGNHHRVGLGRALHTRRDVRRLAEYLAAVGNHYRAGVQADAHGQARPLVERGIQRCHRVDNREPGADGAFRIVLARRRPAEIDEQSIAEILGDMTAEARDGARCGLLVLSDQVAPLLSVELLRERRRTDQVAEEDGQLAALARRRGDFRRGGRESAGCSRRDLKSLTAATAELFGGLNRGAARRTRRGERRAAFCAEAAVRAVVVVAGLAAHRVPSRPR